ncbi:hypothetical protein ACM66B_001853 [Microbotryomycetes sp. NB124-2]
MNFAELKAKAQAAADEAKHRAKAATTKTPARPAPASASASAPGASSYNASAPGAPRPNASASEVRRRYDQSTALQNHDVMQHSTPPPPPIRSSSSNLTPTTTSRPPPTVARKPASLSSSSPTPPALPQRTLSSQRQVPAPPYEHAVSHYSPKPQPPARNVQTGNAAATMKTVANAAPKHKRFSEYDAQDKKSFFDALDEFFESRFSPDQASTSRERNIDTRHHDAHAALRPPVSTNTRPLTPAQFSTHSAIPSYPPPQTHSSSGLSICYWIMQAPYPSPPWYASEDPSQTVPPPLRGRTDTRWTGSWSQLGTQRSLIGFALFGDCSCAWWKIDWDVSKPTNAPGNEARREAVYRPCPAPWTGEQLYKASQMYSDRIVSFARQAVASGRPVARGECWDVAAEALEYAKVGNMPEPFPSIGRTHGHLLFYARSGGEGRGEGLWRGGDVYVRAGDIVEWREVTIRQVGMSKQSYSTLGDPDHTAVIVNVGEVAALPVPDEAFSIAKLPVLTVVEQSQGVAPSEATYDMASMSKGEVWIYRPVALVEYVGTQVSAEWPPRCQTWTTGELAE